MSQITFPSSPTTATPSPLFGGGFDPWYVLLSPPETDRSGEPSLTLKPSLTVRTVRVDYGELAHQAELNAKDIIRNRWRELRSHTPAERAAIVLSSKQFRAGNSLGVLEYLTRSFQERSSPGWEIANYEVRSALDGSLLYYSEVEPDAGAPL